MNNNIFKSQYECNFAPDSRWLALCDRLEQYYRDTPSSMSNKAALPKWHNFLNWCRDNGYTRDEINRAKISIAPRMKDNE